MLDVLIAGKLVKTPEPRTASNGTRYALASVSVPTEGDESLLASCIAFRDSAVAALLALERGDAVSVAGKAKLTHWTDKDGQEKHGLNVQVDQVLSVYAIKRKRDAVPAASKPDAAPAATQARRSAIAADQVAVSGDIGDMLDDLPFQRTARR